MFKKNVMKLCKFSIKIYKKLERNLNVQHNFFKATNRF